MREMNTRNLFHVLLLKPWDKREWSSRGSWCSVIISIITHIPSFWIHSFHQTQTNTSRQALPSSSENFRLIYVFKQSKPPTLMAPPLRYRFKSNSINFSYLVPSIDSCARQWKVTSGRAGRGRVDACTSELGRSEN